MKIKLLDIKKRGFWSVVLKEMCCQKCVFNNQACLDVFYKSEYFSYRVSMPMDVPLWHCTCECSSMWKILKCCVADKLKTIITFNCVKMPVEEISQGGLLLNRPCSFWQDSLYRQTWAISQPRSIPYQGISNPQTTYHRRYYLIEKLVPRCQFTNISLQLYVRNIYLMIFLQDIR